MRYPGDPQQEVREVIENFIKTEISKDNFLCFEMDQEQDQIEPCEHMTYTTTIKVTLRGVRPCYELPESITENN